ncbi:hypothetical protein BKP35_14340 [Anaerobacillus arseniciselenatis]|uniref:Pilus assembly protein PilO n=1 Tax=Anaerobacillus arseniciselenatis TaxID=85682 RepID=A0A1S2LDW7_9BACI|nr:hypothetical protein [Anaerobacillus arseniciselenatis]OIJ10273.1 hypothetical protein BKP35_14340 [Anaerobacillus arseniciselenatis]
MNISFTKKAIVTLIVGVIIVMMLLSGGYVYTVSPKFNERTNAENQLKTEKQMLQLLEERSFDDEEEVEEETTYLQRKLPVEPLVDQLLLDFQRVEALSNTYILSIDIDQNRDAVFIETEEGDENTGEAAEDSASLKQITVNFSVRANSYEELFQFLSEIDRLPRIIGIDSISFIGTDERVMIDDETDILEFLVTVSAYYYPHLPQLKDELPKVIHPAPRERENPLYNH